MQNELIFLMFIAFVFVASYLIGRRIGQKLCPKCGGVLEADHYKYRSIVEWTCRDCCDTFETLKNK